MSHTTEERGLPAASKANEILNGIRLGLVVSAAWMAVTSGRVYANLFVEIADGQPAKFTLWTAAALVVCGVIWFSRIFAGASLALILMLVSVALLGDVVGYRSAGIPMGNALVGSLFLVLPYLLAFVVVQRYPKPLVDLGYIDYLLVVGAVVPILIQGDPMHPIYATLVIGLLALRRHRGWPVAGLLVSCHVAANQIALLALDGFANPWPVKTLFAVLLALVVSVLTLKSIRSDASLGVLPSVGHPPAD